MKNRYEKPELEVVELENDIVTTSIETNTTGDTNTSDGGNNTLA